jgi:hypothetical protein
MSKKEVRLYPNNVIRQITAVDYITGYGKNTTLHYCDGTTETGNYPQSKGNDNFMDMVSTIQSYRKRA